MKNVHISKYKGPPNEVLRRERLLRGWSLNDVADHISCPDARLVRRWENGDIFPSPTYRQRLCEIFGKNAEELGLIREKHTQFVSDEKQALLITRAETGQQALERQALPLVLVEEKAYSSQLTLEECVFEKQESIIDANRLYMLAQVKNTWIVGLLEHSLQTASLIPLALYEDNRLVENPWRHDVQEIDKPPHILPDNTRITQVYDAAFGALLLLGEPGAGKTTLLLTLAVDLLQRARRDEAQPMPVIFHLASWSAQQLPLESWLIEELTLKYQVPRRLGQDWIEQNKLLLLFDGLDEVDPATYENCIIAINKYCKEHSIVPLVVCSRNTEYLAQKRQLLLHRAVIIQPLTTQQIVTYLEQGGEHFTPLHKRFTDDAELQELAKTPLMLDILTRMYQGEHRDTFELLEGGAKRDQLFHIYIQRMFQRRTVQQKYSKEQTLHWLCWLAKRMKQRGQVVFYIETLQFNDLTESAWSRLIPALAFGLISACACWIPYGLFFQVQHFHHPWAQSSLIGSTNAVPTRLGYTDTVPE